jgi:hypothetical protein
MMDKGFRNYLKRKYYIRRLKRNSYWLPYGNSIFDDPHTWKDLYDDRRFTRLRTCATLCSCYMCSGYYKYQRKDYKRETERILKEELW